MSSFFLKGLLKKKTHDQLGSSRPLSRTAGPPAPCTSDRNYILGVAVEPAEDTKAESCLCPAEHRTVQGGRE